MIDVSEIARFTPGKRTLRLVMVLCHQRRYYQTLHSAQESGDARVFVDFMLDMILRTLKEFVSCSAIQKHIERLKDAQRLRRVGPDKGGHWEVIEKA